MRFSTKVFWTIFGVSAVLGSGLIWVSQEIFARRAEQDFVKRYQTLSDVVARSLIQLESGTGSLMRSAAEVVAMKSNTNTPLSRSELMRLRDQLGVTHIFLVNRKGDFVRSTNESPEKIPNLYSFCEKYRDLLQVKGGPDFISTPIIQSYPEPNPFKFLVVPNGNRTQLVEIGVQADYIARALSDALKRDRNITSLKLLTPDGASLGEYYADGVKFDRTAKPLPFDLQTVQKTNEGYRLYSRVEAPKGERYECEASSHARDGKYYYLIEASFSNKELAATLASVKAAFFWVQIGLVFLAAIAARVLSTRVSGRVSSFVDQLREIDQLQPNRRRIGLKGKDEISDLSRTVDQLLDRLESAQEALVTSQKKVVVGQIADEVSHNIKSPIASLEGLTDKLAFLPASDQSIFRKALREIRALSEKLQRQSGRSVTSQLKGEASDEGFAPRLTSAPQGRLVKSDLGCLLTEVVQSKRLEADLSVDLQLSGANGQNPYGLFSEVDPNEFSAVISNLLNNSIEALEGSKGAIRVEVTELQGQIRIVVRDNGKGMPSEVREKLGTERITHGKAQGSGIGFLHVAQNIRKWKGSVSVSLPESGGTEVSVLLPAATPPLWFVPELRIAKRNLIIVDDSPSIHELWRNRNEISTISEISDFYGAQEFLNYWESLSPTTKKDSLVLIDLRFPGEPIDGLQVIEKVRSALDDLSIYLVTNSFDEESVVQRANWLNVKMIPKPAIRGIPIFTEVKTTGITRSAQTVGAQDLTKTNS